MQTSDAPQAQDVPSQAGPSIAGPALSERAVKPQSHWTGVGWLGAAVLIAGAALGGYWFSQRVERVEASAARRLQGTDQKILQLETQGKLYQDEIRELGSRASVLESRLTESMGQQAQLEQLYKSMASESADALLQELERSLLASIQQLQFGGLNSSLLVLGEIDHRLSRLREPSLLGVQRALQRDIERLKSASVHDPVQVAQRLDVMLGQLDALQLVSERRLEAASKGNDASKANDATHTKDTAIKAQASSAADTAKSGKADTFQGISAIGDWLNAEALSRFAQQLGSSLLTAIRDLFRVTRVDHADALLTAPDEAYFLRERLRLHLMSARLAALWRNDALFRSDIQQALGLIQRYFDPQQRLVGVQLESLKQLQSMQLSLDQQALAETLAAIRSTRNANDARQGR